MLQDFCAKNGLDSVPPDLICCTRGPGMVGSLSVSLQLAKGLAIAWNKPLIGVNHMLGHILVSKLTSTPQYPFLSLLVSGGHTMLVHSKSISDHEILIDTCDIAVGDSIDKCARQIGLKGNLLGKELEEYVDSIPECVKLQLDEISTETRNNEFNFQLKLPLRGPHNKAIPDELQFTFAPFLSTIQHYMKNHSLDEGSKQFIAYKTQNHLFEHIIDRVNVALEKHGVVETIRTKGDSKFQGVRDLVFSGGVASNKTFRKLLQKGLNTKLLGAEPDSFSFHFPDISLCTDNAVMIGVAGIDIFENLKIKTDMSVLPIRKWPMNELLTVDGWIKVSEDEVNEVTCK
ncbi:Mitochondrial tRNAs modification protein [Yamadazyma tenuis]|nr:Mitochondrial tRNAs modification protein [Yamadazyma tenuis]